MDTSNIAISCRDYLRIVFRRKLLLFPPIILTTLIAMIGSFFLPRVYRATSTVIIEEKRLLQPIVKGFAVSVPAEERLGTMREEILSWRYLIGTDDEPGVIRKLGMDRKVRTPDELEGLVERVRKDVTISRRGSELILVAYDGGDPVLVRDLVNIITKRYIERRRTGQSKEGESAIGFIEQELRHYKLELERSEAALRSFKERHLLALPGTEKSKLNMAAQLTADLAVVELDIQQTEKMRELIKKQLKAEEKVVVTEHTVQLNPVVGELRAALMRLEMELTTLQARYTEKHPRVLDLRKAVAKTDEQLSREQEKLVSSEISAMNPSYRELEEKYRDAELQIASLAARKKALAKLAVQYTEQARKVPAQEQELAKLTRDNRVNQNMYEMFKNKLETAKISQRMEEADQGTRFEVLDEARLPVKPVRPKKAQIALLGLILGVVIGIGLVFAAEYSDNSFRSADDAIAFLELPVLGTIPSIMERSRTRKKTALQYGLTAAGVALLLASLALVHAYQDAIAWKLGVWFG